MLQIGVAHVAKARNITTKWMEFTVALYMYEEYEITEAGKNITLVSVAKFHSSLMMA